MMLCRLSLTKANCAGAGPSLQKHTGACLLRTTDGRDEQPLLLRNCVAWNSLRRWSLFQNCSRDAIHILLLRAASSNAMKPSFRTVGMKALHRDPIFHNPIEFRLASTVTIRFD
ncbi:hypothetical protein O6H91_Y120900 [Diphasiastrum complanatum]|nr:hypothetical protein O6H91_Y120900 [Diphasiastrum complanatum]